MYAERPSIVPDAVLWQQRSLGGGAVLPDGCMDLLVTADGIMIAGPDTEPFAIDGDGQRFIGLRFAPGRLPGLLGLKAAELRNRRVPLADLIGAGPARRVGEQVITADRPGRSLERYAIALQHDHDHDPSVDAVATMIDEGRTIGDRPRNRPRRATAAQARAAVFRLRAEDVGPHPASPARTPVRCEGRPGSRGGTADRICRSGASDP